MGFFYVGIKITMKALLMAFARWRVEGREHIPQQGPLIVVSNHMSMVDPPLLSASISRSIIFMAKEELFVNWFSRFVCKNFGSFPVKRDHLDGKAIRTAREVLADGRVLGMFPEGKRSPNGRLQKIEAGVSLIASRSRAPILPVGISGTDQVKGPGFIFRRPRINVVIGNAFYLPEGGHKPSRQKLNEYNSLIMERIGELLPEEHRDPE